MIKKDILSAFPEPHTPKTQQLPILKKIDKFLKSDKKFLILSAPTGSGKSFFSKTISNLTNECTENFRELVDSYEIYKLDKHGDFLYKDVLDREKPFGAFALTITKPLQDQYKSFFDDARVLKGKINHQCAIDETKDVEIAPCVIVEKIKKDCWGKCICPYYEDRNRLLTSQFGVLNYSMFLSLPEDLRKKEILICDEAAELEDEIVKRFSLEVKYDRLSSLGVIINKLATDIPQRALEWISHLENELETQINGLTEKARKKDLNEIQRNKLRSLSNIQRSVSNVVGYWSDCKYVIEKSAEKVIFSPLKVDKLSKNIFKFGEKIILMSATIIDHETYAKNLGIEEDNYEYIEVPSCFDAAKAPIYTLGKYKLNHSTIDTYLPKVLGIVQGLLDMYPDQKGIIHTHTGKIATAVKSYFVDKTERLLYWEFGRSNSDIVEQHLNTDAPTVLVSPSLTHGIDLKDELARFQIIIKLPYPPLGSKRIKTLCDLDNRWYTNKMFSGLIQSCGRGIRSETDQCDTYILDGNIKKALFNNKDVLPIHFKERFV